MIDSRSPRTSFEADPARRRALKVLAAAPLALLLGGRAFADEVRAAYDEMIVTTRSGREIRAAYALPLRTPAPVVVLFHEWWGLNNQIKTVAVDLAAKAGYAALAVDFYGGRVAETPAQAQKLMQGLDRDDALDTVNTWFDWLDRRDEVAAPRATLGWCMGGAWSLGASLARPVDATVIYYGNVARKSEELRRLKGPVLGHFATRDQHINKAMVDAFAAEMDKAGKDLTLHWYDADHAFANPSGDRYDAEDAQAAWRRTLDFLAERLNA